LLIKDNVQVSRRCPRCPICGGGFAVHVME
jgi:hypothetical protein